MAFILPWFSDKSWFDAKETKLGLWHLCVPYLAQGSFLPEDQVMQNVSFIHVMLGIENHLSE